MESIPVNGEVGGAGGAYSYNALKRLDKLWSGICSAQEGKKMSTSNLSLILYIMLDDGWFM